MGWSDHTCEPGVIYAAVAARTDYIEFHIDLEDMAGNESQHGHVWNPAKIKETIETVRIMERAWASPDYKPYTEEERNQRADPLDGKRPRILK